MLYLQISPSSPTNDQIAFTDLRTGGKLLLPAQLSKPMLVFQL